MLFPRRQFLGSLVGLMLVPFTRRSRAKARPLISKVEEKPEPRRCFARITGVGNGGSERSAREIIWNTRDGWRDATGEDFWVYEVNGHPVPIGTVVFVLGDRFSASEIFA